MYISRYNYSSAEITARLRDYLEAGNNLPAVLEEIVIRENYTLKDAFIERFNFEEIGFEDYAMFTQRLNEKSINVVYNYKAMFDKQKALLNAEEYVHKTTAKYTGKDFNNNMNSLVNDNDISRQVANENEVVEVLDTTDEFIKLQESYTNLIDKMLNEFKCLFIQVY